MEPKCGEYWWVKIKLTPPLTPMPYEAGELRLAKVICLGNTNEPFSVRLIDCVRNNYLHVNHVEFIEKINKPETL